MWVSNHHCADRYKIMQTAHLVPIHRPNISELTQPRQRQKRKHRKKLINWLIIWAKKALLVLYSQYYIWLTAIAWLPRECDSHDDESFFPFLNLDRVLENTRPRKFVFIWKIYWGQINAIELRRTQIYFNTVEPRLTTTSLLRPYFFDPNVKITESFYYY